MIDQEFCMFVQDSFFYGKQSFLFITFVSVKRQQNESIFGA